MTGDPLTGPGRPATISDVARAAGVSRATVSRVVNGLSTVDATIAARVRATIQALNYTPSGTARSLSLGVTNTVGMVVPDLGNPMFHEVLKGFHRAAAADGYRVLVADSQENAHEEAALAHDARKRCDAVVLCAPRMSGEELAGVLAATSPSVVINRADTPGAAPSVTVDYESGIRAVAQHLVSLGHRRIAFLAGPPASASNAARIAGLEAFLRDRPDVELVRIPCGSSMDDGYQSWPSVEAAAVTAVLAFNDLVALGLIGRLHESGVRVPEDLSVAGFDDVPFGRFSVPALTTVSVDQSGVGATAWRQLHARITGRESRETTVFRPELIVRQSTGVVR